MLKGQAAQILLSDWHQAQLEHRGSSPVFLGWAWHSVGWPGSWWSKFSTKSMVFPGQLKAVKTEAKRRRLTETQREPPRAVKTPFDTLRLPGG